VCVCMLFGSCGAASRGAGMVCMHVCMRVRACMYVYIYECATDAFLCMNFYKRMQIYAFHSIYVNASFIRACPN
jgi:hypothetical protein